MKISQIGGEFALIERLAKIMPLHHDQLIKGIGDDAAVIQLGPESEPYLLVTTDTMVQNHHFRCQWASAEQIGFKAGESNVSDIAAMGGVADWLVVSLTLPREIQVDWVEGLYQGLGDCCRRHGIIMVGGDTTRGPVVIISITLLGHVSRQYLCLRSQAQVGDLMMLTGTLGASAAALALLKKKRQPSSYLLDKHLSPRSRMDVAGRIAPLANAMIDVSDGLGAEVLHICEQSNVGAELSEEKIRLHPDVIAAAALLNCNPLKWVMGGGEDYELLFTISEQNLALLSKQGIAGNPVGKITDAASGANLILRNGKRISLSGGYNHFNG